MKSASGSIVTDLRGVPALEDYAAEGVDEVPANRAPEKSSGGDVVGVGEGVTGVELLLKFSTASRTSVTTVELLGGLSLLGEIICVPLDETGSEFWVHLLENSHEHTLGAPANGVNEGRV